MCNVQSLQVFVPFVHCNYSQYQSIGTAESHVNSNGSTLFQHDEGHGIVVETLVVMV